MSSPAAAFYQALPHPSQELLDLLRVRPEADPLGQAARAAHAYRRGELQEARRWAERCARQDDPRLQALAATILLADRPGSPELLKRLSGLCQAAGSLRMRLVPIRLALDEAARDDDAERHGALVAEARALIAGSDDQELVDEWAYRHACTLCLRDHWREAEAELRRLTACRHLRSCYSIDVGNHILLTLLWQGRYAEMLAALAHPQPGSHDQQLKIRALAWLGRHDSAEAELVAYRTAGAAPSHVSNAAYEMALARGDIDGAITVLRTDDAPLSSREHAEIALLRRRPAEARKALAGLRCGRANHLWLRLALLDGDAAAAATIAQAITTAAGVQGLHRACQRALEASPAQVSALWCTLMSGPAAAATAAVANPRRPQVASPPASGNASPLVGTSAAMTAVRRRIAELAPRAESVLIVGETGTGKEVAAREIHRLGGRSAGPFVAVNCSAIPESLAESLLFGHRRGAFTGADQDRRGLVEMAAGGTLFLDEIGTMPLGLQANLLRLLETGDYRPVGEERVLQLQARVIAASNRDLRAAAAGTFREDLFWRLERWTLPLPPLRTHAEDLPELFRHFATQAGIEPPPALPAGLLARWRSAPWPGNVREFRNLCERLLALRGEDGLQEGPEVAGPAAPANPAMDLGPPAAARRRRRILALLATHSELSRGLVAQQLGCAHATAAADLAFLVARGLLRQQGEGPPRLRYFVRGGGPVG